MAETEYADMLQPRASRGFFMIWAVTVPMIAITVVTIVANGAILTMFLSRRALRRCKNLYFVSLALADFLTGLSMPYQLTKDLHLDWDSGSSCRTFQSLKQSLDYASFLSIFLITLDKWRAMHYPVSYRNRSTKYMTIASVVFVWIISFFIFSLPQFWWDNYIASRFEDSSDTAKIVSSGNGYTSTADDSTDIETSFNNLTQSNEEENSSISNQLNFCPEGYQLSFNLSVFSATFYHFVPLSAMLVFDITLYLKIKLRKSVEVQRSTSVTDTYFMTLKRAGVDITDGSRSGDDDYAKELLLKNSDMKPINKHLSVVSRGERRHSSLPSITPIVKGRTSSGRRVSMPESNTGGGCRYVGRKWSGCAAGMANNQNQTPNPVANLAPRLHNEDMVHAILVKQDRKTTTCLCLMLAVIIACWLPHTIVNIINSHCWCLFGSIITATSWLYQLDHAINPFLYGLLYAQFKNVLKQWLLIERVHAFKMRDTLILKNLQKKMASEEDPLQKSPNPEAKFSHFDISQMTSQTDLTLDSSNNTLL